MTGDVGGEAAAQPARRRPAIVPDPVIVVLLLIAFFSAISGKPLDGGLTLLVAAGLARDARTRGRRILAAPAASEPPSVPVPDAAPAAAGLQLAATRTKAPVPPIGVVLSRIMRTRTGRVGMLVAWAWLGLHFFAK